MGVTSVYLETSFFSQCATIRKNAVDVARRQTSLDWWKTNSKAFDLYVSPEVVRELSSPTFPSEVRNAALKMVRGLKTVAFTEEVAATAELLVGERVMPDLMQVEEGDEEATD